jgi:hypothetical protein
VKACNKIFVDFDQIEPVGGMHAADDMLRDRARARPDFQDPFRAVVGSVVDEIGHCQRGPLAAGQYGPREMEVTAAFLEEQSAIG